jgi:chorismate mutase/prephenate dehydratase
LKITTLGPQGTYSEQAALIFANLYRNEPGVPAIQFTSINNSLRLVQNRQADFAVIPAENMVDGLIGASFDALIEFQDFVKVCDEIHLPINHVLAAPAGVAWDKVRTIYSHPSALNQCQQQLENFFPSTNLIPVVSTAVAAQAVCNDLEQISAAICSREMANNNNMQIYEREIQDYSYNETRFLVCALNDSPPSGNDRTLLAVRYGSNKPGQLFETAKHFAENGIDLTFVQSRPYKVKPQEYVLIFEFVGHKSDPSVEAGLRDIELQVRASNGWKKVLGSFPKREKTI